MMKEKDCFSAGETDTARYFAKAVASRTPLAASFELTRRCNFRCVHCYLGDQECIRRHRHRELDTDAVFRLIDEMVEAGTLFLLLTGGDPMLRPDFVEIYKYAVRAGLLVTVFCNGSLVTDEITRAFLEYPPRMLEITVYGATQETFEAVTQQTGSFSGCMTGIERLRSAGVRLRLKTMVLTLNVDEFPAIRELAMNMGLQFRHDCSIHAAVAHEDNGGRSNVDTDECRLTGPLQYRLSPDQASDVDLSIDELALELAGVIAKSSSTESSDKLYYCGAGRSLYHITPYGKLQPCVIVEEYSVDLNNKGGIVDGWNGRLKEFSLSKASPLFSCSKCRNKGICSGCPGAFALTKGIPEQVDVFYCQYAEMRRNKTLEKKS
ncbi:MAG: radical SAM protein [Candidatus Electrothrix sp. Rat3]|nr:radical SAM protein [Candidatus Electrothrix rattekaaiensis]